MITRKKITVNPACHWTMARDRGDEYFFTLKEYDFRPGAWDMIYALEAKRAKMKKFEVNVSVVILSALDLGFTAHSSIQEIIKRGLLNGFGVCPPEVGPSLRFQHKEEAEEVFIAMKPIMTTYTANEDPMGWPIDPPMVFERPSIFYLTTIKQTPIIDKRQIQGTCSPNSLFAFLDKR